MKKRFVLTLGGGITLLLGLAFFLGGKLQENQSLRQERERLAGMVQLLEARVTSLAGTTNDLATKLAQAEAESRTAAVTASNAVAALTLQEAKNMAAAAHNSDMPRAYQVPVYLGNKSLGWAWAVPRNMRRDPGTGRTIYEQFIRLPEEARGALTTYVTNVIAQPVISPTQVIERDVYVDRGYGWSWVSHEGQGRPVTPDYGQPPPVRPPRPPSPSQPGIYVPPQPGQPGIYVPPGLHRVSR
jgi:hypothetical protein